VDTVFLALRVLVSLGAVLGVIWFTTRWITNGKRSQLARAAKVKQLTIVAKQGLGAKASIAIVETGGRRFLLGVTEHAVTVLDRLELPAEPAVPTTPIRLPSFERALEDAQRSAPPGAPMVVREPIQLMPATRRAAREAETSRPAPSRVSGSLLSADTWRQTAMALRRAR
jgi:flagellar protein FliO/FliZ